MPVHDFDRIIDRRGGDSVKWNSYPADVLPMWVADSDFTAPEPVIRAMEERVRHGAFGYSDSRNESLKRAVEHWLSSRFSWQPDKDWIVFSPSVVVSLALSVRSFTRPGDAVLFLTPSYPPFFSIPRAHGRESLGSSMPVRNGRYEIDFADLEEKMARPATRMFVLCNPHNPTGRVFSQEELCRIGELCLKHGLVIVSDEIHCDYVFPGRRHLPFPSLAPELAERCLMAINPSKTFNIADLHASAVICPNKELRERFSSAAAAMALHSSALGILALSTAYMECAWYVDQLLPYLKRNLDLAASHINERIPGIKTRVPEASYLLWLDCREMGLPQAELKRFFLEKAKLALNSGTDFGVEGEGFMRLNLACPIATVHEALGRLERAANGG
ncbi:pyridoxal phosphate-dependent aminotransferase [Desulfovibrio sp. OttesenSCG-928-A18]|nr:pyridoxal phosphate-dependent aminotransferase [Desulfovibrio sp. OttesenSCG-928-A18]